LTEESPPPRVLIADDQADVLHALRLLLKSEGFKIDTACYPAAILSAVEAKDFDAVLLDLNYTRDTTSGREGLDLLSEIQRLDGTLPVIVMTAWGSVETAVEAMRCGARDYIQKPWDNARLLATLRTQVELGQALRREQRLEEESRRLRRQGLPELIAESRVMAPVLEIMERVAPSEANVLITGEHGTGKDVVARWLHAASDRASEPLVTMNAGGVAESLFESELFGHVKGAYTDAKSDRIGCFELADGGTLFLDEIANVPLKQQAKLLRVLESGELQRVGSSKTRTVDVRVLSATNANITEVVAEGGFREDLLYRLNTVEVHLPPLRDRREDIPLLAAYFLRRHAEKYRKPAVRFESDAMRALLGHSWPGNVRELEHVVERSLLMARGDAVRAEDLGLRGATDGSAQLEQMKLDDAERFLIQKALDRYAGNVSHAAAALGLSRSALYRRLQRYDLLNPSTSDE
jgi:DNA-binding NtrC family response regulator